MAQRPVFISNPKVEGFVQIKNIDFEWYPGFSIKQKQNSIESFHESINKIDPSLNVLEISSKSHNELGVSLSAFNLMIKTNNNKEFSVETAFQASKVFELGGPYLDLYEKSSKEAKKDPRIRNSGKLLYFKYFGRIWGLEPKTLFYDWLYINALSLNEYLSKEIIKYDAFTDIEFNPQKSINCQAKSAALFVSLYKTNLLKEALSSVEKFNEIAFEKYYNTKKEKKEDKERFQQISFFDEND